MVLSFSNTVDNMNELLYLTPLRSKWEDVFKDNFYLVSQVSEGRESITIFP